MARFHSFSALAAVLIASVPSRAHAGDAALADQLFQQALTLSDSGNWDAACPLFVQSNAADPSVGALLNLAVCSQRTGKFLEARSQYEDAFKRNESTADEVRREAVRAQVQQALATLNQGIPRVSVVTVPAGAIVSIDGRPASVGAGGTEVDPGTHLVHASAPGYDDAELKVAVVRGDRKDVKIAMVRSLVGAPPPSVSDSSSSSTLIPGILVLSTGALLSGVGATILGFTASKASEVRDLCGDGARPPECSGTAEDAVRATELSSEGQKFEIAGGVLTGVGAVTLGAGIAVLIAGVTGGDESEVAVSWTLAPGEIGCTFTSHF